MSVFPFGPCFSCTQSCRCKHHVIHTHTQTTHGSVLCHPRSQLHTPTIYKYEADTAAIPTLHTVRGTSHKGNSRKVTVTKLWSQRALRLAASDRLTPTVTVCLSYHGT
jgi:hypothetical protein